jgi:hypothetical protein
MAAFEDPEPTGSKSWKDRHAELLSPPPELSRDTTELSLTFELPVPKSDLTRVLVSGGTDTLTVNDVAPLGEDGSKDVLYHFVETQLPALNKVRVLFRLTRAIKGQLVTDEPTETDPMKTWLFSILCNLVELSKLSTPCKFVIKTDCMWVDDNPEHSTALKERDNAGQRRNILREFDDCAEVMGSPKPIIVQE